MFHVLNLRKNVPDLSQIIRIEELEVEPDLTFPEQLVHILEKFIKRLRNKNVPLVKVLRRNQKVKQATWENKANMK